MKHTKYNFLFSIALLIKSMTSGQSYFPLFPNDIHLTNAEIMGTASTGITGSPSYGSLWENPAMLGHLQDQILGSLTFGLHRREEFRAVPMIDMFEDIVTRNAYAGNRNFYNSYAGGITARLSFLKNVSFGLGLSPFWDYHYNYSEEVRGNLPSGTYNRDPLAGYHTIKRDGNIQKLGAGVSFKIISNLHLGISISSLRSSSLYNRTEIVVMDTTQGIDDALAGYPYSLGGDISLGRSDLLIHTGVTMDFGEYTRIGFSYKSDLSITIENNSWFPILNERTQLPGLINVSDTLFVHDIRLPSQIGMGISRKLDHNLYPVSVHIECRYTDWSSYSYSFRPLIDSLSNLSHQFTETWDIRTGIEYMIHNQFPVRMGFIFKESPMGAEFESSIITLGTSYSLDRITMNISGWFNRIDYIYEDIFPANTATLETLETITEWNSQVVLTLSYSL